MPSGRRIGESVVRMGKDMGRIGATLSGIERTLLNRLAEANTAIDLGSLRLASGVKISAARDDPSGFVTLSRFQSELIVVTGTLSNVTEASKLVAQVQLTLDQIRTQLDTIRASAVADEDGQLTASQRAANQATIDQAIEEINRLATTEIGGRRLLDGSANFAFSGLNNSQVFDLQVLSSGHASSQTISGTVDVAAAQAQLTHTGASGQVTADATITLTGDRGSQTIAINNGENLTDARDRINAEAHVTGVTASVAGDVLTFSSIDFGLDADVAVTVESGTFAVTGGNGDGTASGSDAQATINGLSYTGAGNRFTINDNSFRFSIEFAGAFSGAFNTVTVSGSPPAFDLSGDLGRLAQLPIPGLQAARLGGLSGTLDQLQSGGSAAGLGASAPLAVRVVDEALGDLDIIEGLVDGFADQAIAASSSLLSEFQSEINKGIDSLNQVDDSEEALLLAKNQALADNSLSGLSILSQQRSDVVALIKQAAGLI